MQTKRRFISVLTKSLYIIWTILLSVILSIIVKQTYTYAQYIAEQNTTTMVNKDILYRNWVASHGGVYVPIDKKTPPNPYLAHVKNRDIKANNKNYTLMNPAYTLRQMMKEYSKIYGVHTKITSKKFINPINKPDIWETIALNKIEQTRKKIYNFVTENGLPYLRSMTPLFIKKGCLKCHAFQGYKIGDIRGGISVSMPMQKLYQDAKEKSLFIGALFLIIWLLGIILISLFSKKIYKYINEKETLYEEYVYGLVNVIEKRDTYTAGHSTRVAHYAELIAKEMKLTQHQCHLLHRAGMLHDIGKVAIPDSVFLKPTKLTAFEYDLIKEHVTMSYDMLKKISIFDEIKEIVRDHHEHYDGSGYPRGLTGNDTPILAQILTLADSFDAMSTDRIYKGRKTVDEALKEIAILSGKQFNPKIVQAALIALKDIIIDHTKHQNPKSLIEKERFSYFYKDPLTNVYNETYLRLEIHNIPQDTTIAWISIDNFHQFNKKNGWSAGDKILQDIADAIKYNCKMHTNIYRFYGDNFLIFFNNKIKSQDITNNINEILKSINISYKIKIAKIDNIKIDKLKNLEDILKKLF